MTLLEKQQIFWDYFIADDKIGNPYGVAGLMGNVMAESGFNPKNLSNAANKKLGMTDAEYTEAVDKGTYKNFINDGFDYGLCQWVYSSRKKGLYNLSKKTGKSIGDYELQLDYIWQELQAYSSVLKVLQGAKSIREASDDVLTRYEKPAKQGEKEKVKRAGYGEEIFNNLLLRKFNCGDEDTMNEDKGFRIPEKVRITGNTVNLRTGDSTDYPEIGTLRGGTVHEVAGVSVATGWYAVRTPRYVLWVSNKYCEPVYEDEET